ncbi:MAG: hypothetical protein GX321_09690, partial [Clostridiales bacterium]|nr:hypothetical protein [Clostridiales bacterium]
YYLNARMYDPKIARFLQEDTYTGQADDPLSLNLYTYCANNPIIYWDPTGHFYYIGNEQKSSFEKPVFEDKDKMINSDVTGDIEKRKVDKHKGTGKTDNKPSQETGNYRTVVLPDEVKGEVNGEPKVLYPNDKWGVIGKGNYPKGIQMTEDGRYKVAVAPKILDPNYPDDGKIWNDDIIGINRDIDVVLKNKSTGEIITINCYVRDIKAHSYNYYSDDKNNVSASFNIESGLIQTGIAYPKSENKLKFAPDNIDASVIEFTGHSTGEFNPNNYKLVEIRVYK